MTARSRLFPVLLAGAAALLTLVTACSIPSRPLWWPHPKHTAHAVGDRFMAGPTASVPTVRDPWHPGMRQLGIHVYWTANRTDSSDAVIQAKAQRIIDYAISLNANSIAVTFPFFTYGLTSDTVYANPEVTPSPSHIAIFLAVAARAHIRVTLRPLLNEAVLIAKNPMAWRGTIAPLDRAAWFESYQRLLLPYLAVAQAGHAATFVLGTELDSMEGAAQWPDFIRSLRSVYTGQLAYDQNFDRFAMDVATLPEPTRDVDAYPRFDLPDSASVASLTRYWDAWLGAHPLAVRRSLTLSEVGIDAVAGAYQDPGAWVTTRTARIDTRVQTAWYQAVCNAVSDEQIGGGIYWWEVNFDANPADPGVYASDRLTFLDRPAQQVIRNCFARLSS